MQGGAAGERARAELQALHHDGVSIAIDDFGTGFSSLGQLRRFPIDMIKVDRSFIQGAEHDPRDAAITANVVSLAHALGLVAMAEGIESEAQLASLRELGCDLAQGFLFARAMPPAELAELLGGAAWELAARGLTSRPRYLPVAPVAPCSSFVGSISELVPAGSTAMRSSGLSFWIAMYCRTLAESEALSLRLASA